jgi:hypothetical protein
MPFSRRFYPKRLTVMSCVPRRRNSGSSTSVGWRNLACHQKYSQTFTDREHPVGLYHRLVRQLLRPQPQGSPEGSEVCTTNHRGQTTCPPGHLHHPISQEGQTDHQGQQPNEPQPVHRATIQKARSVQGASKLWQKLFFRLSISRQSD